jgi:parvulin-like peptidyl-prolyl isomerase
MLDRFRNRIRPAQGPYSTLPQQRLSRREKELRQQRMLYIIAGAAAAIVIVVLLVGAAYQYYFYPNHAVASVNGNKITRSDYWKVRELQLRQNIAQLSQQMQFVSADQQAQIQQQIQTAQTELDQGHDAPISEDTLSSMVDNLVILQNLDDFGISISTDEVQQYIENQFSPAPSASPTPTSGIDPTAQAWATSTSEAQAAAATQTVEAAQTAAAASPTAAATGEATGTAASAETVTPEATGTVAAEGEQGTPAASPTEGTPEPTATLEPDAAQATTESRLDFYKSNYLGPSDMSMSDYRRLIAKPELARKKVREQLVAQVPTRAEQVHAAHILVATQDAAQQVYERVTSGGEDFAAVAKEVSTDTGTAANGGDLGWFPRGVMVKPFEDAAFSLDVGEVSKPVQTEFGWHVIKVLEKDPDRPITAETLQTLQSKAFSDWLDAKREAADISSDITLSSLSTPTPEAQFQAPPDAPALPTPTLAPTQAPSEGSPTTEAAPSEATSTP